MISLRGNPGLPRKKKANGLLLNRECVVGKSGDGFTLFAKCNHSMLGFKQDVLRDGIPYTCPLLRRPSPRDNAADRSGRLPILLASGSKKMEKPNGPNADFGKESTLSSGLHIISSGR